MLGNISDTFKILKRSSSVSPLIHTSTHRFVVSPLNSYRIYEIRYFENTAGRHTCIQKAGV